MIIPDLIGMKRDKAMLFLQSLENYYNIEINETLSPLKEIKKDSTQECRVVRQRVFDNTINIMVSYF